MNHQSYAVSHNYGGCLRSWSHPNPSEAQRSIERFEQRHRLASTFGGLPSGTPWPWPSLNGCRIPEISSFKSAALRCDQSKSVFVFRLLGRTHPPIQANKPIIFHRTSAAACCARVAMSFVVQQLRRWAPLKRWNWTSDVPCLGFLLGEIFCKNHPKNPTSKFQAAEKWVFPKIVNRGPQKWMVYNGKPYENGWFGGTTIFGNIQIVNPRHF